MTSDGDPLGRVRARIREVISGSSVPEDPGHSINTLKWLLKFEPHADEALQIAALGHDIDRAVEESKVVRANFSDYDDFKAAHARHSAEMLAVILEECGIDDRTLVDEVFRLVLFHEVGGDARSDLLVDADSVSYFDVNLPLYRERNSREETLRRCIWGYRRLSRRARIVAVEIPSHDDELAQLMEEAIARAGGLDELQSGSAAARS